LKKFGHFIPKLGEIQGFSSRRRESPPKRPLLAVNPACYGHGLCNERFHKKLERFKTRWWSLNVQLFTACAENVYGFELNNLNMHITSTYFSNYSVQT